MFQKLTLKGKFCLLKKICYNNSTKGVIMKKFLLLSLVAVLSSCGAYAINPTYTAPNASNMNFYPLMQHQMEKQETLDFANHPEEYKKRREAKDNENKIRNSNFNPNYSPNYGGTYLHPVHPVTMQFTKGSDGQIKIESIQSTPKTTIKSLEKSE